MMSNHFNLDRFLMWLSEFWLGNWSSVQAVVYKTHFPYVVYTINGGNIIIKSTICPSCILKYYYSMLRELTLTHTTFFSKYSYK